MMSPQAALWGNGPVRRCSAASMRNNTAKTRTILSATITGIGMLSIASRAAGHAVASAAARSGTSTKSPTTGIGLEIVSHPVPAAAAARPIQTPNIPANVTLATRGTSMNVIRVLTTSTIQATVMTVPMNRARCCPLGLSPRLGDGGAFAHWAKRKCLAQAGLEQTRRQQPAQPAQEDCLADWPSHAIRPFDRSQHFLGDEFRLWRRVGVMGDHFCRALALRRIGVDPTLRLCGARIEIGFSIVRLNQDHADAKRAHFMVERLRQPFESVLGARIDAHERRGYQSQDRADVDDQARTLLPHAWQHGMDHAQDTDDVGVEQRLRLADACFLDGADEIDAGIVNQHVDPAYSATQLFNAGLDRNLISDIQRYDLDARERSCRCACTDAAKDPVTPGSQQLGGYAADAGRCASD